MRRQLQAWATACALSLLAVAALAQPQPPARPGAAPQAPAARPAEPQQPPAQPGPKRFQRDELTSEALRYEQRLRVEAPPGTRPAAEWRREGEAARGRRDHRAAVRALGAAALADPRSVETWLLLTDSLVVLFDGAGNDFEQRNELEWRMSAAALIAYQRAVRPEDEARALFILANTLNRRSNFRGALDAYRASLDIRDDAAVRRIYEPILERHGFRFLDLQIDNDAASPRACFQFSERLPRRLDAAPFVQLPPGFQGAVTAEGQQVCVEGLRHGERYVFTLRPGLPSTVGESLRRPVEQIVYVRDRTPAVRFTGRNYVLPRTGQQGVPLVSVNLSEVAIEVLRYADRSVTYAVGDDAFMSQITGSDLARLRSDETSRVFQGVLETRNALNEEVTTAIPVADTLGRLQPGVYVIVAHRADRNPADEPWEALATQWLIVSDLGLQALTAPDGIVASVRSLGTAAALAGVEVRLVSRANEIIATERTGADGTARFPAAVIRGLDAAAPGVLVAQSADGDYGVLDLASAAFDLSDRGVTGRAAPGPLDAFVHTERGVYRGGETVHATILVRDGAGAAPAQSLPATVILERPDGIEARRELVADAGAGGRTLSLALPRGAATGSWRLRVHADPRRPPIGDARFLVEDYVPERLDFDLTPADRPLTAGEPLEARIAGRWLFGAPAADVGIEAEVILRPAPQGPRGFEAYRFGLHDEDPIDARRAYDGLGQTDRDGRATLRLALPVAPTSTRPLEARLIARLVEAGGRPVERALTLPVSERKRLIGVRPTFGASIGEGETAGFDVVVLGEDGRQAALQGLRWELSRVETRFQWYRADGRWTFESVTSARRVADGRIDARADAPARVSARVEWGRYRLEVNSPDGRTATSLTFDAGMAGAIAADAPDVLEVGLDRERYAPGDTARLRIGARAAGRAAVAVVGERVHVLKDVALTEGANTVDIPVGADWGAGAHVLVSAIRPLDAQARRMPGRAVGVAWLGIDPAPRTLALTLDAPDAARPRRPLEVGVRIAGLAGGETAHVVIAAVDVGILNLTRHQPPRPGDWFHGRRALSAELRDLYGALIDGMQGTRGRVRSGGDVGPQLDGSPPKEAPVVFFSGVLPVAADGTARATFDLPAFAGALRLTAVAWSAARVGEASREIAVRDPVVALGTAPRFLAQGDQSRLFLDVQNVEGPAGDYGLSWRAAGPVALGAPSRRVVRLEPGQRGQIAIPVSATGIGDARIDVSIDGPNGVGTASGFDIAVRPPHGLVTRRTIRPLSANGGAIEVGPDVFADMIPGSGRVSVSVDVDQAFDVPGLLDRLDLYPYGCTEQIVSAAVPLLVLDRIAPNWRPRAGDPAEAVRGAVERVLARQASNGSFGLWSVGGNDLWLDAFVTDFLLRARDRGVPIQRTALDLALDRLRNALAENREIEDGEGKGEAYALYVLARAGRPVIGDLRYVADVKLDALGSPLARAQIGAALAAMGDRSRVSTAFASAVRFLSDPDADPADRIDFGSSLRDAAAVLALAGEAQVDRRVIAALVAEVARIAPQRRRPSTQEALWIALGAEAARAEGERIRLDLDGTVHQGPWRTTVAQADVLARRIRVANAGAAPVQASVTVTAAPTTPEPAAAAGGFELARSWHRPDGTPVDMAQIRQNDRIVVVLRVTEGEPRDARIVIEDRIPAGFAIENPALLEGGRVRAPSFVQTDVRAEAVSFRDEGMFAAFDRSADSPQTFTIAYQMRALAPGRYVMPGAYLEDMYRPDRFARTLTGVVEIGAPR